VLPGWYGKLPSLGDFASRRLDADAVSLWDDWLSTAMVGLREAAQADWLASYLRAPRWQFVLLPAALPAGCDPGGAAGILMPSVDRVGRYFPLLILQPLPGLSPSQAGAPALWRWLAGLDGVAADALDQDWTVEQLEQALSQSPAPTARELQLAAEPEPVVDWATSHPDQDPVPRLDAAQWIRGEQRWTPQASGCTYWLSRSHSQVAELWAFQGLPPVPSDLFGLLDLR
jgi:type VI secretion system protein ImpM